MFPFPLATPSFPEQNQERNHRQVRQATAAPRSLFPSCYPLSLTLPHLFCCLTRETHSEEKSSTPPLSALHPPQNTASLLAWLHQLPPDLPQQQAASQTLLHLLTQTPSRRETLLYKIVHFEADLTILLKGIQKLSDTLPEKQELYLATLHALLHPNPQGETPLHRMSYRKESLPTLLLFLRLLPPDSQQKTRLLHTYAQGLNLKSPFQQYKPLHWLPHNKESFCHFLALIELCPPGSYAQETLIHAFAQAITWENHEGKSMVHLLDGFPQIFQAVFSFLLRFTPFNLEDPEKKQSFTPQLIQAFQGYFTLQSDAVMTLLRQFVPGFPKRTAFCAQLFNAIPFTDQNPHWIEINALLKKEQNPLRIAAIDTWPGLPQGEGSIASLIDSFTAEALHETN